LRQAVFLDRDGVLNRVIVRGGVPSPPAGVDEVEILPGVAEALALLEEHGFSRIVVTNQPDVARGTLTHAVVEAIHRYLLERLPLDAVLTCYHDDADGCGCRKPKPGLLLEAAARYGIDLHRSFLVGDRWRDIGAGEAAGCLTFLVPSPADHPPGQCPPARRAASLLDAAREIVRLTGNAREK